MNTQTFRRFHDAVNSRSLDAIASAIDEAVAPDLVFHTRAPFSATGVDALKQVWVVLLRAFPDIHVAIEDEIAAGDKVVYRNTVTGTHLGEYRGIAPTGNPISYDEIFIVRFAGGRIAELWGVVDVFAQLQQIGAIHSPVAGGGPR